MRTGGQLLLGCFRRGRQLRLVGRVRRVTPARSVGRVIERGKHGGNALDRARESQRHGVPAGFVPDRQFVAPDIAVVQEPCSSDQCRQAQFSTRCAWSTTAA